MASPGMAASWDGCSLVFLLTLNKSKNLVVIFLTLNKLKKLATKLPREKPMHPSPILYFQPSPVQSDSRLPHPTLFFECIGIQFFNSLTCDLQDAMPHQRSLTLIPREVEDFPRGDRHFKHVPPPPTYLICLSPKELYTVGLFKPYDCSNL